MKYEIKPSSRFKRDMKLVKKRGYDQRLIENVIRTLAAGEELDKKYRDHLLLGDYAGFHECHITPDWLLSDLRGRTLSAAFQNGVTQRSVLT